LANFNRKEHLRHRAVSLRQHGFLVDFTKTVKQAGDRIFSFASIRQKSSQYGITLQSYCTSKKGAIFYASQCICFFDTFICASVCLSANVPAGFQISKTLIAGTDSLESPIRLWDGDFRSKHCSLGLGAISFLCADYEEQSVRVRLTDVNDEVPQFQNVPRPFLAMVSSDAPLGTSVYQLVATDRDRGSLVRYALESGKYTIPLLLFY